MVVQAELAARIHFRPVMPKVEPALKANQPHQSMNKPKINAFFKVLRRLRLGLQLSQQDQITKIAA